MADAAATKVAAKVAPVILRQGEIGNVSCPTNSQTNTTDGAQHVMARAYPMVVAPTAPIDKASYDKAVAEWVDKASRIAAGAEVIVIHNELLGEDGKPLEIARAIPSDSVPSREPEKETTTAMRDNKPVEVTVVDHGLNFAKSLPIDYAEQINSMNQGIRNNVYKNGLAEITEEFRAEGRKGKRAAGPDFSKLG